MDTCTGTPQDTPQAAAGGRAPALGPLGLFAGEAALLAVYVGAVLPAVDRLLHRWQERASHIPDPELRRQALASLRTKRFHCQGGAVFAAAVPAHRRPLLIEAVVALQTISDYLDNLCDRSESLDPADYRQLHQAMLDAVAVPGRSLPAGPGRPRRGGDGRPLPGGPLPGGPLPAKLLSGGPEEPGRRAAPGFPSRSPGPARDGRSYYRLHPHRDDGGYLESLVAACQQALARFPGYPQVAGTIQRLVSLYSDLQVNKHGDREGRLARLAAWYRREAGPWQERLAWWEFAAACGSTLGVFALFREALLAAEPSPARVKALAGAYFPWIGGLHILLDYLIDQAEDRAGGDLNLVRPYGDPQRAAAGLAAFARQAARQAELLPDAALHRLVVDGLLGLYLTDPKVARQGLEPVARQLVAAGGPGARLCLAASRFVRRWRRL
ncbi:tetraprenyl-beta-curcumene synthase family protein [Thermaerobacter sp. PB12/4term]|uniref:tetraprenyl-beta-curcumene synthase family protein n=1 Tax=Thermaerobacter sp. PB12/4term TaxID=2293838 RepID=UPI00193FC952|nr:tetraprenyl-beta-curcumene synthase family protein [Thermaerobacter sp. PB12/4term]